MLAVRTPTLGRYRYNRRMAGLGQDESVTTIDPGIVAAADQPIVESTYPGLSPAAPSGINWNAILPGLFGAGEQVAKQLTLPTGAYTVTTPQGTQIMARNVPGAVPGGLALPGAAAGGSTLLLLGGGALLLMFFLSRK